MPAPDVDDEVAVDVDGNGRADFLSAGYLLCERFRDLVEAGIPVALHDVAHLTIIR